MVVAPKIDDVQTYLNGMKTTSADKCWWVSQITNDIINIVDFGCADGSLYTTLKHIFPHYRFNYYGVDNSSEFIQFSNSNEWVFSNSIEEVIKRIDTSKSILVLNSVLHEIFSYLSSKEQNKLFKLLFESGFKYIAIRDMHMPVGLKTTSPNHKIKQDIKKINNSKYYKQWHDFRKTCLTRSLEYKLEFIQLCEFLLKYRYNSNWLRECKEQYFWDWFSKLINNNNRYKVIYDKQFYIPFICNRVKKDFGIDWNYNTHRKCLLRLHSV